MESENLVRRGCASATKNTEEWDALEKRTFVVNDASSATKSMPTLLHSVSAQTVAHENGPSETSQSSSRGGVQERMRRALVGKSPEALIEMHIGLHSLLAQQIVEQRRLTAELEATKSEAQRLKILLATRTSSEIDEAADTEGRAQTSQCVQETGSLQLPRHSLRTVSANVCVQKVQTVQITSVESNVCHPISVTVAGLPPVQKSPAVPTSFPGKAPAPPPPPPSSQGAQPCKTQHPSAAAALIKALGARFKSSGRQETTDRQAENHTTPAASKTKPSHNRVPLFWASATGSPSRVSHSKTSTADMFLASTKQTAVTQSAVEPVASLSLEKKVVEGSIFDQCSSDDTLKTILCDPRLAVWFTKRPVTKKVGAKSPDVSTGNNSRRPTCLSAAASQKYHITVRCFKKEFEGRGGWSKFKQSILQCQLTKAQISLLLETIPDADIHENNRKLLEWEEAVARVAKLKTEHPQEPLYEDEEFVYYLSTIPDLHRRLSCMLVMASFDELVSQISGTIEVLMDALEILVTNKTLPKLFQAILMLGNYFNEGTPLGNRRWFRISTLQKVASCRGVGPQAKSLVHLLASHFGPFVTPEEASIVHKAAQITIVSAVNQVKQVEDIFGILSEQSQKAEHIMKRRRRNSVLPDVDDTNDRFAEVGAEFVRSQQGRFDDLRQDAERLLRVEKTPPRGDPPLCRQDYKLCALYFGDSEAFIPIDRRVEDERNPGQQRFVQDIFGTFDDWIRQYMSALSEVTTERKEKPTTMKRLKSTGNLKPASLTPDTPCSHSQSMPSVVSVASSSAVPTAAAEAEKNVHRPVALAQQHSLSLASHQRDGVPDITTREAVITHEKPVLSSLPVPREIKPTFQQHMWTSERGLAAAAAAAASFEIPSVGNATTTDSE